MFDDIATDITLRQYALPHETTVEEVLSRAAEVVSPVLDREYVDKIKDLMLSKKFSPGGRILAGAGTDHGNLLNCFVQDGNPQEPGTTEFALQLALKLAIVTRVGGGNGLNLDSFPPKRDFNAEEVGLVRIYIDPDHPDAEDFYSGTFMDLVTGQRVTRGYKYMLTDKSLNPEKYDFLYKIDDNTEDIWETAALVVQDILEGQNVTVDFSNLRPEGSPVKGSGGTSSGPASFAVEIFENFVHWACLGAAKFAGPVATLRYVFAPTLRVIRQGGVRRGAGMATLSASHADIKDFITAKDLAREAEEGDISTFNMSVLVDDYFMERVGVGDPYVSPIFDSIAIQAWKTGEPGVLFVDTINLHNILFAAKGPILATNPCGEIPLYPGEPCDLGAINVAEFFNFDWDKGRVTRGINQIEQAAYLSSMYLDAILDVEKAPTQEIADAIKSYRRIGLGMMGLADALIKLGLPYDSAEARELAGEIAAAIRRGAERYTDEAHYAKGAPPGLEGIIARRNVAMLTVAPTGTTAMVMGTTSGIEPLFAPFIYRRVGTEYKQILHPLFKATLDRHDPTPAFAEWDSGDETNPTWTMVGWDWAKLTQAISDNHGSVASLKGVPKEVRDVFRCAHDISPMDHVDMQAVIQRAFDWYPEWPDKTYLGNSISKTINLPTTATVSDVQRVYSRGYFKGLKGITVYRDGSRGLQVLSTKMEEDDGSTANSQARDEQLGEIVAATCSLDGSCDS